MEDLEKTKKRQIAEQTLKNQMKINPPEQSNELDDETTLELVSSVAWLPTTTLRMSLQLNTKNRVFFDYEIDEVDSVWDELPHSHKLLSCVNVKILDSDDSEWENADGWSELRQFVRFDGFDGQLFLYDSDKVKNAPVNKDGTLTVKIWIRLYEAGIFETPTSEMRVCSDLLKSLEEEMGADLRIIAKDGVEVKAHKLILASRSAVFKAMLTGDTVEAKSGVIKMKDVSSTALKSVLRYLYGGEVPTFVVNDVDHPKFPCISQLIYLADKYMLDELKESFNTNLKLCCDAGEPKDAIFLLQVAKHYSLTTAQKEVRTFIIYKKKKMLPYALDVLESCKCESPALMEVDEEKEEA